LKILGRFKEKLFEEDFKKTLLNNLSKLRSKLNKSSKIIVELKSKGESRILYFMGKVIFSFNCNYVGDIDFELLRSIYTLRNAAYQYLILPSLLILFIVLVSIPYGFSGASATMIASSLLVLSQLMRAHARKIERTDQVLKTHYHLCSNYSEYFRVYTFTKTIILKSIEICKNAEHTGFARGFIQIENKFYKYLCVFEKKKRKVIFSKY